MDLNAVISEVGTWPVEDRLRLIDAIRDGLPDPEVDSGLSEDQLEEIRCRIAEDDADPDDVVTWEEVNADLLKRAGR